MASVYLAPGVYVEEFDSGPVPMAGGPTAVPAFVGFTEKVPRKDDKPGNKLDYAPRLVTSWSQYERSYGGYGTGDWTLGHRPMLPAAIFGYFNNGGQLAYVVPLQWQATPGDSSEPSADKPSTVYEDPKELGERSKPFFGKNTSLGVPIAGNEAEAAIELQTGVSDGEVAITIEDGPEPEAPAGGGATPDPTFVIRVRHNGREVLELAELTQATAAQQIKTQLKLAENEDENFPKNLLVVDEGALAGMPKPGKYSLVLPEPTPTQVDPIDVQGSLKNREGIEALQIFDNVTMLVMPDLYNLARRERLRGVDPRQADDPSAVNTKIGEAVTAKAAVVAAEAAYEAGRAEVRQATMELDEADAGQRAAAQGVLKTKKTALAGLLEAVDTAEGTLATASEAANDLMEDYNKVADDWREVDLDVWKIVQTMMINHCQAQTNRLAILDPPPVKHRPDQVHPWRMDQAGYDAQPAALYYPWLQIADPVLGGKNKMFVPPSGHMAGVWARNDDTRGVHKAPANEVVRGAIGVQYEATMREQMLLNPDGVNAIRPFAGAGIRVWGARTLSSNANWKYINVRRLFSWVEKTILDQTQWVVFEPNDQATWDRVTRTVSNFLTGLWRDGALFGASPEEAFYVHCNEDTNPPENRENGILTCIVGMAPVMPAEFVVFRVTQKKPE